MNRNETKPLAGKPVMHWNLPRHFEPVIPLPVLRERRKELQRRLSERGVLVLYSAEEKVHSGSVSFPFRQDSDFYYLTGLNIHPARLIVTGDQMVLFSDPPDPEREIWEGIRPNHEELCELCPVDAVYNLAQFEDRLTELLRGRSRLYYSFGQNAQRDHEVLSKLEWMIRRGRAGQSGPNAVFHTQVLLHEMRMIKSAYEIEQMLETASITAEAHRAIQAAVRPGMYEYELEALILETFRRHNATWAYPSIVASGVNACILHYVENSRRIEEGDLILVDAGASKHNINSDVTRTFPATGRFSPEQRAVHDAVLRAHEAALKKTIVGSSMDDSHLAAIEVLVDFLIEEKILKESREVCMEQELYKPFYMHRTGHYIGYDVHDVGAYYGHGGQEWIDAELGPRRLRAGMVCTVEPGLYFSPGLPESRHFAGIGIRIEDDVLVTPAEPRILTTGIPRSADEIEAFMQGSRS
jgi:Xaa-Pro aminopeptidase